MIWQRDTAPNYKIFLSVMIAVSLLLGACGRTEAAEGPGSWNYDVLQEDVDIQQWYVHNDGSFSQYLNDYAAWTSSEKKTVSDIDIGYEETQGWYLPKREAVIAIIDSDVDETVFSDETVRWVNKKEIPSDNIDNDGNGYVDDIYGWNFCDDNHILFHKEDYGMHGTYITSLLFGKDESRKFCGVLADKEVLCMNLKVLHGEDECGKIENIVKAIEYARMMGADICCLSLATQMYSPELERVIEESNMLFVVAAGNMGEEIGDENLIYPACFEAENVIVVGDMRPDGQSSKASNYSLTYVDVFAPGTDVIGKLPNDKYTSLGGTSAAAAMVAAESVLLFCMSEDVLTASEIRDIIIKTAVQTSDYDNLAVAKGYICIDNAIKFLEESKSYNE